MRQTVNENNRKTDSEAINEVATEKKNQDQVLIVSIFGRGHWLAIEWARKGIPVTLIDVSHLMGDWQASEAEGPFGFFKTDIVQAGQFESLQQGAELEEVKEGFCLWLQSGPMAFRSPLFVVRQKALGIADSCIEFLRGGVDKIAPNGPVVFAHNWPAILAQSWASTVVNQLGHKLQSKTLSRLFAPFYIRHLKAQSLTKSLQWLQAQGKGLPLQVFSEAEIHDVSFAEKNLVSGLEVKIQRQELFRCEKLVWCLTSQETQRLSPKLQEALYPQGTVEPEWFWSRFELERKSKNSAVAINTVADLLWNQIPAHCMLLQDEYLPWSHANMAVMQKHGNQFSLWVRLPSSYRFQKQAMEEIGFKLMQMMRERFPFSDFVMAEPPKEMLLSSKELGPARHPVYGEATVVQRTSHSMRNVYFDSPEVWPRLGCDGAWTTQSVIFEQVSAWWAHKEELRLKRLAKEEAKRRKNMKNEVEL